MVAACPCFKTRIFAESGAFLIHINPFSFRFATVSHRYEKRG